MHDPHEKPLRFKPRHGARVAGAFTLSTRKGLAACLVAATVLTAIASESVSTLFAAPGPSIMPAMGSSPAIMPAAVSQTVATTEDDLLIFGKGTLSPLESASLLFPSRGDDLQSLIMASATANNLPYDFFLRLLRQESGLNPRAISPAGALGIAQFMPGTAAERGLRNPFDPTEAIPKSAELLRDHHARFGNLGLAAAAYNAGPQRVWDWLSGRAVMPAETRDYVLRITGRAIETWAFPGKQTLPVFLASQGTGVLFATPGLSVLRAAPAEMTKRPGNTARASQRTGHLPKVQEARARSPRSEQALCAAMNSEGHSCLVQAVY